MCMKHMAICTSHTMSWVSTKLCPVMSVGSRKDSWIPQPGHNGFHSRLIPSINQSRHRLIIFMFVSSNHRWNIDTILKISQMYLGVECDSYIGPSQFYSLVCDWYNCAVNVQICLQFLRLIRTQCIAVYSHSAMSSSRPYIITRYHSMAELFRPHWRTPS